MRLSEDSKDNWPTHRGFGGLDWASQKHNVVIVDSAGLSKGYTRLSSSHRIATQETHHMSRRVPASNRSGRHPDEAAHGGLVLVYRQAADPSRFSDGRDDRGIIL